MVSECHTPATATLPVVDREAETTAMLAAVRAGDLGALSRLLDSNANCNHQSAHSGESPLELAVRGDCVGVVEALLHANANPNGGTSQSGVDPITIAAYLGRTACLVEMLGASTDAVAHSLSALSPWQAAVICGNSGVAGVLLRTGRINVDARFPNGTTPLLAAAQLGHTDLVAILLRHEADPDERCTQYGAAPLHTVAEGDHVPIATMLLEHGADPNARRHDGTTALYIAAFNGYGALVGVLLGGGANPDVPEPRDGTTALMVASEEGHGDVVARLLGGGATVDRTSHRRRYTALCYAAEEGHPAVVAALCTAGADVEHSTVDGSRPLFLGLDSGVDAVALALLAHGASPTRRSTVGVTPLFHATAAGRLAVCRGLLRRGASGNAYNSHQYVGSMVDGSPTEVVAGTNETHPSSPMMLALHLNMLDAVQLMASYGTSLHDLYLIGSSRSSGWRKGRAVSHWVDAVIAERSSPLEIAVGCRDTAAVRDQLCRGRDPHQFPQLFRLSMDPRPWGRAALPSSTLSLLLFAALQPWRSKSHSLFGPHVHTAVSSTLLSVGRMRAAAGVGVRLPNLPSEMWLLIFSFLTRTR